MLPPSMATTSGREARQAGKPEARIPTSNPRLMQRIWVEGRTLNLAIKPAVIFAMSTFE